MQFSVIASDDPPVIARLHVSIRSFILTKLYELIYAKDPLSGPTRNVVTHPVR